VWGLKPYLGGTIRSPVLLLGFFILIIGITLVFFISLSGQSAGSDIEIPAISFHSLESGTAPEPVTSVAISSGQEVRIRPDGDTGVPAFLTGDITPPAAADREGSAVAFFEENRDLYQMRSPGEELALSREETDGLGMTHLRLDQVYRGVPVFGRQLAVHFSPEGRITAINGSYYPGLDLSVEPQLTAGEAVANARAAAGAGDAYAPDAPQLVILTQAGQGGLLTWKVTVISDSRMMDMSYFIDARTGAAAAALSNVEDTRYRETYTMNNSIVYDWLPGDLLIVEGDPPNPDTVAQTTHDNAGLTYDYYLGTFGRNSFDDAGSRVISVVHYRHNFNNAGWDDGKELMVFGDGDGTDYGPFGNSLDIVAHEFTHGVTYSTAGLVYENQPGALNESYSDVFGCMVDRDDWLHGEDTRTPAIPGDAVRSLEDPPLYGQPDHMDDYVVTTDDNGGIHTNSGIPNKAAYNVATAIGKDKVEQIWYRTLVYYLTSSDQFIDARDASLQAAAELYGFSSPEASAVMDGFAAVGITSPVPPTVTNVSPSGILAEGTTATTISADYTDYSGSGIDTGSVSVTLDDVPLSCTAGPAAVSCPVTSLAAGEHTIGGSVADNDGYSSPVIGHFTIGDAAAPQVLDIKPDAKVYGDEVTISADYHDANIATGLASGVDAASITLILDGSPLSGCIVTESFYRCTVSSLAGGDHHFEGSVSDNAGNITPISIAFQVNVYEISDTVNDCGLIGSWNSTENRCSLFYDLVRSQILVTMDGVTIDGQGHMMDGQGVHYIGGPPFNSIAVAATAADDIAVRNLRISDYGMGIFLGETNNASVSDCFITGNGRGLRLVNTVGSLVFHNSFENNSDQAEVTGGSGNLFNQPAPVGGNHWTDFDSPVEGCSDGDSDHICDAAYSFPGGVDDLPFNTMWGWDVEAPVITSVEPGGLASEKSVVVSVSYTDGGNPSSGIDAGASTVALDGIPLAGCNFTDTAVTCNSVPVGYGPHTIDVTIADVAGNATTAVESFTSDVVVLTNGKTGGDCYKVGSWDDGTWTCTLSKDLVAANIAVILDSGGITLDGGGHTLTGPGSDPDVVPAHSAGVVTLDNTTVRNLTIQDFVNGIRGYGGVTAEQGIGNTISGVIVQNCHYGILYRGGGQDTVISGNSISTTGGITSEGIGISGGARIEGNSLTSDGAAIHVRGDNNAIADNVITGPGVPPSGSVGIYLDNDTGSSDHSTGNTVSHNMISGNSRGLMARSTDYNVISGNTFSGNSVDGMSIGVSSAHNQVYANNFLGNTVQAIIETTAGWSNVFSLPLPDGGNYWDDFDEPAEGCVDADIDGFCDAPYVFSGGQDDLPRTGVYDGGAPEVSGVSPAGPLHSDNGTVLVEYNDLIAPFPSSGIDISSFSVSLDGTPLGGCTVTDTQASCPVSGLGYGPHSIEGSIADNAGNVAPFSSSFSVDIVIIRDQPGGYHCDAVGDWDPATRTCTLTTHLHAGGTGILLDGDGLTLDGDGYSLMGEDNLNGVEINGRTGATVRNLHVEHFANGFDVSSSSGVTLESNEADKSVRGIALYGSTGSSLVGNAVFKDQIGILASTASDGNLIRDNLLEQNTEYGLYIFSSAGNTVYGNSFFANAYQAGANVKYSNTFNLPAPDGGNYWDNWTTPDSDHDGFVDNPFIIVNVVDSIIHVADKDYLPLTTAGPDIRAPEITALTYKVACGAVLVGWTTDEPATSTVGYATAPGGPYTAIGDPALVTDHGVYITGLAGDTTYYYRAVSDDNHGNSATSAEESFHMPPAAEKPVLQLSFVDIYWLSYVDYLDQDLSVDYTLENVDSEPALGVTAVGSVNTNGVTHISPLLPYNLGDIYPAFPYQGAPAAFTYKYHIPVGVGSFRSTSYFIGYGPCGEPFEYPGPYSGI